MENHDAPSKRYSEDWGESDWYSEMVIILYIIDKLWPAFVAVLATQLVIQKLIEMRKPKLEMVREGVKAHSWKTLDGSSESPYHMWRIKVQHIKIPRYLAWLIKNREAALQCEADLTFYNSKDDALFTMQGRWAKSPEVSLISPLNQREKIIYPDTIGIGYDLPEPLDCIVKFDDDTATYGWNNESYATGGKNPRCKLEIGEYRVDVRLSGQNFRQFTTKFNIVICRDWQGTSLTLAEDQPSA